MSAMKVAFVEQDDWVLAAACRGQQDLFFPPDTLETKGERRRREARAKALCAGCAVRAECLSQAVIDHEWFGIWGGLTERERRAKYSRLRSPQDIAGPGRPVRLPAVVVQGRQMSFPEGERLT
jgi:WhiB family redox-sensing transcriptional regulator